MGISMAIFWNNEQEILSKPLACRKEDLFADMTQQQFSSLNMVKSFLIKKQKLPK